jgi:UDP-GlcNAc:undecaprenyl-phosphate GlcNAc-1-phosphate transferase
VNFPLNIYLLSIVGGTFTALLTLPLWQSWCRRVGLVDDPGHRKIHTQAIPLAGGLAVLTGILLPLTAAVVAVKCHLLNAQSADSLAYGLTQRASQLAALLGGAIAMTCLGALDDKHELRPALKFAGQFLIAALVAAAGIRITLFVPSLFFSYAITILWILTVTNAFNFMDNMNGLCAGLGTIASLIIAIASARHEYYLVAAPLEKGLAPEDVELVNDPSEAIDRAFAVVRSGDLIVVQVDEVEPMLSCVMAHFERVVGDQD